jgi:hypothetical protein
MRIFTVKAAIILIAANFFTASATPSAPTSSTYHFTLKIYDGRTGHQVRWMPVPYIFAGNQSDFEAAKRKLDFFGEVNVDINNPDPAQVKVWIDFLQRDCRFQSEDQGRAIVFTFDGKTMAMLPSYSLEEIKEVGVVSQNFCGKVNRKPEPGVLAIFVMPETFRQLWNS